METLYVIFTAESRTYQDTLGWWGWTELDSQPVCDRPK